MYVKLCRKLRIAADNLKNDTRGIAALEYAILAAVILVAVVAAFQNADVSALFTKMTTALTDANAL